MTDKILNFFKNYKYVTIWTLCYIFVMWFILLFMFNFNMFVWQNWIKLFHAHLKGFPGFVFGILILAAIPMYIATTSIIIRTKKPLFVPKTPKWLQNDNGGGIVFSGKVKSVNAQIIAVGDGTLKFIFRGPDMRVDGKRVQLWIDYSSIKIDGAEVLSAPISTWHNKPFIYEMPVTNGQVITLEFTQTPHKYSDEELNALLNTLKNNPLLVETDIKIIRDFYRKAQQSD